MLGASDPDVRAAFGDLMILTRAMALALETSRAALTALPPSAEAASALTAMTTNGTVLAAVSALIGLEKHAVVMALIDAARVVGDVNTAYASLNDTVWLGGPGNEADDVAANADPIAGADLASQANNAIPLIRPHFDTLYGATQGPVPDVEIRCRGGAERPVRQPPRDERGA